MNSDFTINTRLYLNKKGSIFVGNTISENLVDVSYGSALFINSTELSVHVSYSKFHNCSCTSTGINFGGAICVQNAHLFIMNYSCFSNNFAYGSPDIIVWGTYPSRQVDFSSINISSFCKSSTYSLSESCSNWFSATLLTMHSINTSSMNSNVRCSAFGVASIDGVNMPKTSYFLIENGKESNYIIEICSVSSTQLHIFDHFVITNCEAKLAVISNRRSASCALQFKDSIIDNINCKSKLWKDSQSLTLSRLDTYSGVHCHRH